MKKILLTVFLLLLAVPLMAQTQRTNTTLSSAISNAGTGTNASNVTIASSTSVVARSGSVVNTYLVIDQEVLAVLDLVNGPTCSTTCTYTTSRGMRGTAGATHESSAIVWVVASNQIYDSLAYGSCTASAQAFPRIVVAANTRPASVFYQSCDANLIGPTAGVGMWGLQTTLDNAIPFVQACSVPVGSVAYSSFGSSVVTTTGSAYLVDVFVPYTQQFTGVKILAGTAGTDKWIGVVYDSLGNVLATSAVAGTSTATANTFQTLAFTAKYIITGPSRYFLGVISNGNADSVRTVNLNTFPDKLSSKNLQTGSFGTVSSQTPPTTDAGSTGPIGCLY